MKFEYSNAGLTVSYETQDETAYSRQIQVTVNGETRTDDISIKEAAYIQECLNASYDDNNIEPTVQMVGDKVCEIYWGMIL